MMVRLNSRDNSTVIRTHEATPQSEDRSSDALHDSTGALSKLTESATINGRTQVNVFDAAFRKWTGTSPAGRQTLTTLDAAGRPTQSQMGNLAAAAFGYDSRGRLATMNIGTRTAGFVYDGANRLTSATDPLGRTVRFAYDAADRATTQTLPDGRIIGFAYDANGNVTSVTPPSRPAHSFLFTPVDLMSR